MRAPDLAPERPNKPAGSAPELRELGTGPAATLLAATSDLALVLDREGVIRDLAINSDELNRDGYARWVGQSWVDTVTVECRGKIESLLKDAANDAAPKWRQVNHPSPRGVDVPMMYSTLKVGDDGRIVAIGRDLRGMAALQQRLVDAQQSMERDYTRLRQAETRYRLLFQLASAAVLIVEASSRKITDANPAALALIGSNTRKLVGSPLAECFPEADAIVVNDMLTTVKAIGRTDEQRVTGGERKLPLTITASLFREEAGEHYLVRLTTADTHEAATVNAAHSRVAAIMEQTPDGFVVTDQHDRILAANPAFLDLVQLATEAQVEGESLERWLGRPGVDMSVLAANLKQYGSVRCFATKLRGEYGSTIDVEISAVAVPNGDEACCGYVIRDVGRRLGTQARTVRELPRSVDQLTELIGHVSLKDLVREATDVIERLCIEAALELTGDNRASAAEMLGLSRQSFYVKMRRHGLGDLTPEADK